jgi:hypothetical protein
MVDKPIVVPFYEPKPILDSLLLRKKRVRRVVRVRDISYYSELDIPMKVG